MEIQYMRYWLVYQLLHQEQEIFLYYMTACSLKMHVLGLSKFFFLVKYMLLTLKMCEKSASMNIFPFIRFVIEKFFTASPPVTFECETCALWERTSYEILFLLSCQNWFVICSEGGKLFLFIWNCWLFDIKY